MKSLLFICFLFIIVNSETIENPGLEYLTDYTVFLTQDYTAEESTCTGKICINGNVNLNNFNVGSDIKTNCSNPLIISGDRIIFTQSQALSGYLSYVSSVNTTNSNVPCGTINQPTGYNFTSIFDTFQNTSSTLGTFFANGDQSLSFQDLKLTGSDPQINVFSISGQTLTTITSLEIDVPENSRAYINIIGDPITFVGVDVSVSDTTNSSMILYNLPNTKTTTVGSEGLIGSLLAPASTIAFPSGNINGSIAAVSLAGNGVINYHPYNAPQCICSPNKDQISLPDYELFVHYNTFITNNQNQGRFAGGNVCVFNHYTIGLGLNSSYANANNLVCGGDLFFNSGTVIGNILYGGEEDVNDSSYGTLTKGNSGIDFDSVFGNLISNSVFVSQLPTNGNITIEFTYNVTFTGTNELLNTFLVTPDQLKGATNLTVDAPSESWVVINVSGNKTELIGMQMTISTINKQRVLWNFYESSTVEFSGISIQGSVLAPNADVFFNSGNIDGSIYCANIYGIQGSGSISLYPWIPFTIPITPCKCNNSN
eukprot:TRINITY_DN3204_c0_g1_i1.p1 TRINITY_DN3204_c0_g1~~TRINITY_DN3204_c0_g1_i1.p1  ORF type:complete len:540 (-),score=158.79 TRINITY_DN3204_c0_g1_i1:199-1818(-)